MSENIVHVYIDFQNLSKSISTDLFKYYINIPNRPYPAKRICDTKTRDEIVARWEKSLSEFTCVHTAWQLDFEKFRIYLQDHFGANRITIFIGYITSNEPFYNRLKRWWYEITFKQTLVQGMVIKGNVDAELVMHASLDIDNYTQAILVTGDGDFFCLAEELHKRWKLLRIITPNDQTFSQLYKPFLTLILPLTKLRDKLKYEKTSIGPKT